MRCNQIKKHLSAYLDGELHFFTTYKVRRHLSSCSSCQADWETFKQIHDVSRRALSAKPEPGFYSRLRERLPQEKPVHVTRRSNLQNFWTIVPFSGKAAIVAGLAGIVFMSLIYPRLLFNSPALSIDQLEEEYLRSRETLSWVTETTPSLILVEEQRG